MFQQDSSFALIPSCQICMVELSCSRQYLKVCQDQNEICDECLDSWVSSQLTLKSTNTQRQFFFIKCPFSTCKKLFDLESFLFKVDLIKLPKTSTELFKNFCRENNNITNCPNSYCNNIGFLDPEQTCRQNLQCDMCQYTWKLPSQKYFIEQLIDCFQIFQGKNQSSNNLNKNELIRKIFMEKYEGTKTSLYKLIFSKSCTNCGISISRNGGCKQMRCEKCYHHFCWDCGQTINFRHQGFKCSVNKYKEDRQQMMHLNKQENQEDNESVELEEDQEQKSDYDNDIDDDNEFQDRNLSNELKEALLKSKIMLKRALFSYAYYRLSKLILNYFAKKLLNTDINDFFYWNIFKFSEIVVKK